MFDSITMDTIELTWEEKVCCYFFREICDWLSVKVLWDTIQKRFVVRNYRVDDDMAMYLWEENWDKEFYRSLLDVYVSLADRGYIEDIEWYIETHRWEEWDSRLQWCKLVKQFLGNWTILNILDDITFDRVYSPRYAYSHFNIGDVQKLLRAITIRDRRYLYVW